MRHLARFLSCPARLALTGVGGSAVVALTVATPAAALGHLFGVCLTLTAVVAMVAPGAELCDLCDGAGPLCDDCRGR